jgi:hypothetical protein
VSGSPSGCLKSRTAGTLSSLGKGVLFHRVVEKFLLKIYLLQNYEKINFYYFKFFKKGISWGWRCSLVVEHLPSMHEACIQSPASWESKGT